MWGAIMRVIPVVVLTLSIALPWQAWAQMGSSLLRGSSRMVERTVSRNLDKVFRPKLVVRQGSTGPVTAMSLSQDERYLVSAVGDFSVRLWDLGVGREAARMSGHQAEITTIAISPDGRRLLTGSRDKTLRLWNLQQGELLKTETGFSQPLSAAIFLDQDHWVAADESGTIMVSGKAVAAHGPGPVRLAAQGGERFVSAGADGILKLWDIKAGPVAQQSLGAAVTSVAADAETVVVGLADGRVLRLDAALTQVGELGQKHAGAVTALAVGRDGRVASAGADGHVLVWSSRNSVELGRHDGAVSHVGMGKDGEFAISASQDGTTRLWSIATRKPLVTLLSTTDGWAVVDSKGRYDGNQDGLDGIDWQGEDATVGIESFAETHFEAALLPRALHQDELADAKSIPDGVRYPAKIRFVSPKSSGDSENPRVQVEVEATDDGGSGVAELRLYRNGRQVTTRSVDIRRETSEDGSPRVVGRFELDLRAGRNVLSATAVNDDRMESPAQNLVLNAEPPPPGPPKIHLMTVGINAYANKDLSLFYAKPDAQSIGGFFTKSGQIPDPLGSTVTIEDSKATKDNILAALNELRAMPAQDMVVVYMAGHGVSIGDDWYFVPHELRDADSDESLKAQGLSSMELKRAIESMTADRTLLLLDTCHSGTAVSPLKDYRGMKSLRLLARSVGTHILAATDRDQYAIELAKLGHGIFTYALLEGLKGKADTAPADGSVSAGEIIRYVEEKVPMLAAKYTDYAQYPTGYSRGKDFAVSVAPGK
ncbi:MAG: hypothetical protein BGO92_13330 [Magnetospirillum sp. 64-120]|nr:MAG: hypothetical protein BGO92_13330 [Magnetospirillum sp. 64-120]